MAQSIVATIDGVDVRYERDNGAVYWMSDWSQCDRLADAGLLVRKSYGPSTYGHTDFFVPVTPALMERVVVRDRDGALVYASDHLTEADAAGTARRLVEYGAIMRGQTVAVSANVAEMVSPYVRRALAGTMPADAHGARAFVR